MILIQPLPGELIDPEADLWQPVKPPGKYEQGSLKLSLNLLVET